MMRLAGANRGNMSAANPVQAATTPTALAWPAQSMGGAGRSAAGGGGPSRSPVMT